MATSKEVTIIFDYHPEKGISFVEAYGDGRDNIVASISLGYFYDSMEPEIEELIKQDLEGRYKWTGCIIWSQDYWNGDYDEEWQGKVERIGEFNVGWA